MGGYTSSYTSTVPTASVDGASSHPRHHHLLQQHSVRQDPDAQLAPRRGHQRLVVVERRLLPQVDGVGGLVDGVLGVEQMQWRLVAKGGVGD